MAKKLRVQNTPEFKYFANHYDDFMKEDEEDEELKDMGIPKEWDESFRKVMRDTLEEKEKRKRSHFFMSLAFLIVLATWIFIFVYRYR